MMRTKILAGKPRTIVTGLLGVAGLLVLAGGCSQTVESKPAAVEQVESGQTPAAVSGFFGSDASLLQPGKEGQASMVYVNPNAQWKQ